MGQDYGHKPMPQGWIPGAYPWHTLLADIMGPLLTCGSLWFIITFLDVLSGYCVLILSVDHTALTVARALMDRVIAYFSTPPYILSDQGQEFMGVFMGKTRTVA